MQWTGSSFQREWGSPGKCDSIKDLQEDVLVSDSPGTLPGGTLTFAGHPFLMQEDLHLGARLRFGVFELDIRAGELRKHGLRVRLQEQPFQLLTMLVEHPGEVVTREELQKKLWP